MGNNCPDNGEYFKISFTYNFDFASPISVRFPNYPTVDQNDGTVDLREGIELGGSIVS